MSSGGSGPCWSLAVLVSLGGSWGGATGLKEAGVQPPGAAGQGSMVCAPFNMQAGGS